MTCGVGRAKSGVLGESRPQPDQHQLQLLIGIHAQALSFLIDRLMYMHLHFPFQTL